MNSVVERREACKVSREILEKMTTDALIETIINYPFLIDVYAFSTIDEGIKHISTYFSGIDILSKRNDARYYLFEKQKNIKFDNDSDVMKRIYLETLSDYLFGLNQVQSTYEYVYTPNGSAVLAEKDLTWADHGITQTTANYMSQTYLSVYPSSSIMAVANPKYNCHSYAFHSMLTTNRYWISDPSAYLTDGSYSQTTVGVSRRITYYSGGYTHSGVVYSSGSSLSNIMVESKWGALAVFVHAANDCPYYSSSVTIKYWY